MNLSAFRLTKKVGFFVLGAVLIIVAVLLVVFLGFGGSIEAEDLEPQHDALEDQYGPVRHVYIMFRHGARNPNFFVPTDPYKDPSLWPEGSGALTQEGVLQQFKLGEWIARRYSHLLPKDWRKINQAVRVVSTDVERTIMSAISHTEGMFPIQDSENWSGMRSYPVPVHVLPGDYDDNLQVSKSCPKINQLKQEFFLSQDYMKIYNENKATFEYLKNHSGLESVVLNDFFGLHSTLGIEENRGFALPKWTDSIYPEKTKYLTAIDVIVETWTDDLKRLRGGPIVKKMFKNFDDKLSGSSQNLSIYSAHDTTVSSLLNTMGVYDYVPPPFAATVMVELRQKTTSNSTDPLVTIWYKVNNTDPTLMVLPNCEEACPFSQMKKNLMHLIPDDWDKECQVTV